MTVSPITQDPVTVLSARWGMTVAEARRKTCSLADTLRELDTIADALNDHGLTVDVDLGGVGDAARAARRDLERESGKPTFSMWKSMEAGKPTFSFPKPR